MIGGVVEMLFLGIGIPALLATAILFCHASPDKGARTETSTRRAATPYSREAEPMSAEDTIKQTVTEPMTWSCS
jgi:hypothetical protein